MRQDLVLSSNPPMLAQRSFGYPCRTARSSSLPLKILTQQNNKNSAALSDKLIHSWNGSLATTRLCMYTNLSVSDFCINLIGNDLPINDIKQLLAQRKQLTKVCHSSDESNSDSTESICIQASSSDVESVESVESAESEVETQFTLEQQPDSTITSSGYSSESSQSDQCGKLTDTDLDETCRNSDSDDLSSSSSDEDLFKEFRPKKSCLKKLCLGECGELEAAVNATSSPLNPSTPISPSFSLGSLSPSFTSTTTTTSCSSSIIGSKKRVSFADTNGKELCTIRTMSEPSNCPPKLTSKIVEYILSREMALSNRHANTTTTTGANSMDFYSNYTSYGISSSSDASIAVYSLNFAQPAGDYIKFRQRLDESKVCLENVVLNRFSITGTIKVKNINFDKQVFVRCSFDKWSRYQDTQAQYVPAEYYSTAIGPGSPTAAYSATFYEANYQSPVHKDYDTFRFQFDLPKHVQGGDAAANNSPNNIIQFCVCYRTGRDEYWDNNLGANYEILQYVIGITKPAATNKSTLKSKSNSCFRYDSAALSKATHYSLSNQSSSIYY